MIWKTIYGNDKKVILDKLFEISKILRTENFHDNNLNIMAGRSGIVLFLVYYAKLVDEQEPYDFALELLTSIIEDINKGFSYHTHAGGLAGIGTLISILTNEDLIDADTDELLGVLDEYLYKMMIEEIKIGNYDFLHGGIGIGLYFLKRSSNKNSFEYLTNFVHEIDKIATKDEQGIRWLSVLSHEKELKGYNLSLSHGLASIIAFLSKLYLTGIAKEKVTELLNGAVKYLLNQQLDISNYKSNFPSWVCDQEPSTYSRLAWCYGDLGIGIALWQAGNNVNRVEWKERAIDILLHSATRRDLLENSVVDAGLCHGSAGIAHIYNRMFHYTGNDKFKEAALYWFDETLKMAKYEDGFAGYKIWRSEKNGGMKKEYGFLEGIAGIGLAFISAVSEIQPNWDECLLLS